MKKNKQYQLFHITCKGIIFHKNKFLLHRSDDPDFYGSLECPGGRIDRGESIEDVLKRELSEEIGLNLNNTEHIIELFELNQRDEKEYGWDEKTQIIEIYYIITIPNNINFKISAKEEVSSLEWITKKTNLDSFPYRVSSRKYIYKKAQNLLK